MKVSGIAAVVTGGASGMGAATARHLASLGAKVALLDINAASCEAVANEIGGAAFACDITDGASVEKALKDAKARHGAEKKPKKAASNVLRRRKGSAGEPADPARFYYKGSRQKQLRAFVATVKLGTLTRAAEALFLSQPSVSLQLQALERELGVTLMERSRRRINLTDAGEALYERARPLVEGWENLDRDFQAKVKGLQAGKLVIAAGTSTIQYLLPELVRRYRERYPAVQMAMLDSERPG